MIQLSLEHFLISLYRKDILPLAEPRLAKSVRLKQDEELLEHLKNYMELHINQQLTVEQICHDNLVGLSQLQNLFRSKCGCGIIEYFSQMKICRAKELIREKNMNFTQIADYLGYTSIHYFSRQFKKIAGMTPSEGFRECNDRRYEMSMLNHMRAFHPYDPEVFASNLSYLPSTRHCAVQTQYWPG